MLIKFSIISSLSKNFNKSSLHKISFRLSIMLIKFSNFNFLCSVFYFSKEIIYLYSNSSGTLLCNSTNYYLRLSKSSNFFFNNFFLSLYTTSTMKIISPFKFLSVDISIFKIFCEFYKFYILLLFANKLLTRILFQFFLL